MVAKTRARPKTTNIGGRLRRMRYGRNLTQEELAEVAGMSPDTINKLEGGRTHPRPGTVRKLAAALGVEAEDLTGGVGK